MNWNRILYYSIFTLIVSMVAAVVFANSSGAFLMWGFVLVMGAGYAYGTFQALGQAKKDYQKLVEDALKDENNSQRK